MPKDGAEVVGSPHCPSAWAGSARSTAWWIRRARPTASPRADVAWLDPFGSLRLVVLTEQGGGVERSLPVVRTDAAGVPTAVDIETPPRLRTLRAADFDDDRRTDLLVVSAGDTELDLEVRILFFTPP